MQVYLLYILLFQFFERLELFAEESVRKHAELTERIRKEVGNRSYSLAHVYHTTMPAFCLL